MDYGFIYRITEFIIRLFKLINIVELLKIIIAKIFADKHKRANIIKYERIGTDVYIVLKWGFILLLWNFQVSNIWATIFVWYLILMNLFTYLYYHIWDDAALNTAEFPVERIKRRFINSMLSLSFSIYSFAYLYAVPYAQDIKWIKNNPTTTNSILFSISNAFAANYVDVLPINDTGNLICIIELINTFIFVAIIISRSIPQTISTE